MKAIVPLLLLCILAAISCKEPSHQPLTNQTIEVDPPSEDRVNVAAESEDRYAWQKPELVIDKLGDINGKVIADIGAGTGYFAFRLMRKADKVIAVDIDADMLELIDIFRANLDSLDQRKIETRQASAESANLMISEVDIAFIVNTIGYIEDKGAYLSDLKRSLKDQGELMIVDFKIAASNISTL